VIRKITPPLARHIHPAADAGWGVIQRTNWDACVIGSGPGGAVAAATLANAGWRVVLIERGRFQPVETMSFGLLDMPLRLGRFELTKKARIVVHQGNVLGGGSIAWGAMAMKPPAFVFDEWAQLSGTTALTQKNLAPHYDYTGRVLSVTRQHPAHENRNNAIVRHIAATLGCPDGLEVVHRYTEGCRGIGLCTLGCGVDEKGTMANSFLPMALETGNLTVLTGCEALAFHGDRSGGLFGATHLLAASIDPGSGERVSKFAISARHFVVAAGAIHSSALLLRTHDLQRQSECGRVCLQPHATVHALFDAPVTGGFPEGGGERSVPSSGVPAVYNFTGMLRDRGYGWFASALHPASLATATAHLSPSDQLDLISRFHHTSSISITVRDDPDRSRIQMRNGRATLDYLESASDRRSLRRCLADVSRGLLAVGARRVFLPLLNPPGIEHVSDVDAVERMDLSFDRVLLYADHLSGGNPVGATSEQGVTDSNGRVFGSRNIHVADASLLPSACGVGPSWTIMALSRSVALSLVADCSIVQGSSPQRSPAGQPRNPP